MPETVEKTPPRPSPKADAPKPRRQSLTERAQGAANDAGDRILGGVESNPLGILAAGVAVGLAAGTLLPKTKVEGRYLGSLGAALNEGAMTAARAAGEAGKAELTAVGISRLGANEQVGKLLEGFGSAIRSAGDAARSTRKRPSASDTTVADDTGEDFADDGEENTGRRKG